MKYTLIYSLPIWLLAVLFVEMPVAQTDDDDEVLQVFVREGCPHCADAKEFLPEFAAERPWLRIIYRSLDEDPIAGEDLVRYSEQAGIWPPGVPTFVFRDEVVVGFGTAETSGPVLAALVEGGDPGQSAIDAGWLGTLNLEELGLPLFTLALGLVDGFNPCAMWVLLFLLSMLVRLQDRKRMVLVAGTFVLVSGAVYYAFMAAWLNLFLALGLSLLLRMVLACLALTMGYINVRDYFRPEHGFTLSIPGAAKPGIYRRVRELLKTENLLSSLWAVAALAVIVNFVELLCTAGFPAIYTAILTQQGLSPAMHYAYLGLYILGYIFDDSVMVVIAVLALSNRRLTENAGRVLKLISGSAMLALGVIMLVKPEWLL